LKIHFYNSGYVSETIICTLVDMSLGKSFVVDLTVGQHMTLVNGNFCMK